MGYLQFHRLGQMRKTKGSDKGYQRSSNPANDKKPTPRRAKSSSQPHNKQPRDSPLGPSSLPMYTPPTLRRADMGNEDMDGGDIDDTGNDVNMRFFSHFQTADSNDEQEDDSSDDEDDDDDIEDEDDPSASSSTVAVISAAKSSPLLNLSSTAVHNLSTTELVQLGDSDPGVLLIQRMVQATLISSVQPSMVELQAKLEHAQTAAVRTEIQQLAQEFRNNRRAHHAAAGTVEDLTSLLSDPSGSVNVGLTQRQLARAQDALHTLEKDMLSVLKALNDKCMHYGLIIGEYISQEDTHLLERIPHE